MSPAATAPTLAGRTDTRTDVRTVVVGAGPGALSVVLALQCRGLDAEPLVIDPSGTWLARWRRRFRAQGIPNLRSPAVHHPHPDAFALLGRADDHDLVRSGGVHLPTTALFDRFIDELVEDHALAPLVRADHVARIDVDRDGAPTVVTGSGEVVRAGQVIVATDRRVAPDVMRDPDLPTGRVCGVDGADVADVRAGERVAVVGGGLSAVHLAIGAARRGAEVVLVARRSLEVRRFDTHPSWLGPARLREFRSVVDPAARHRAIVNARGGGTVPHRFRRELAELEDAGAVTCIERAELAAVRAGRDGIDIELRAPGPASDRMRGLDRVWLATGGRVDVASDPLCGALVAGAPATLAGGLPDLDADLCWPGTRVHLLGASAGLVLGPTAGNLVGLRRGAQRIAAALAGEDPARADRAITGAGACVVPTPPGRMRDERPSSADRAERPRRRQERARR